MGLQNHYEVLLEQDLQKLSAQYPALQGEIDSFKSQALEAMQNYKEFGVYLAFDNLSIDGTGIKYTLILNPTDAKSKELIDRIIAEGDYAVPVETRTQK